MIVYLTMLLLSLLFAIMTQKTQKKSLYVLFAVLSGVMFALVSSIRYDVGTDYLFRYVNDYKIIINGGDVKNLEIGFKILDRVCILLTDNYQLLFVLTSIIITSFIFYTIYRDSKNVVLSIILYFTGAFFFQSLNMVRQYIAISIILYSYKYLIDKKMIKWSILVFVASLFHSTSLVFFIINIMLYLIDKIFKNNVLLNKKIVFVLIAIIFIGKPIIGYIINCFLSLTRFGVYIKTNYNKGDLQIIHFMINLLLYIGMIYICIRKKDKITNIDKFFVSMQALALIFVTLGTISYLSIRFVYYFSIFQIISIPHFLKYIKYIYDDKKYIIFTIITVLIFSSTVVWTHILHTTDEVLPYKTIFNKDYEFK